MMKKTILAMLLVMVFGAPALADNKKTGKKSDNSETQITGLNKKWNVDVELIKKLAKKEKCKEVIMYREVLPFFGRENTLKASKEITVQFEKEDLASGRAMILHEKSKCDDLLGNFLVMCTTDTALCYFEEPRTADKDKKSANKTAKKKTKTADSKKTMKAKKTKTQ